jgi:D-alanine--poly(phosphoribitol) ligase subunit 1
MLDEQRFSEGEVFLNQAPFSFDLSVMDLYCSLTTGGTLFSISRDLIENPKKLYRALESSGVTTWVSTPSFAQMCLVEDKFAEGMLPQLRRFLFCGETLAPRTAAQLLERFPQAQVWNMYGPTEATVATTSVRIDAPILEKYSPLPVGRVMPGTKVFIVDGDGAELSANERGEIIIAGTNVST